jgi:hypothetical protein
LLRAFEIASLLLRLDHVARFIVKRDFTASRERLENFAYSICVIRFIAQPTEWQRVGD